MGDEAEHFYADPDLGTREQVEGQLQLAVPDAGLLDDILEWRTPPKPALAMVRGCSVSGG